MNFHKRFPTVLFYALCFNAATSNAWAENIQGLHKFSPNETLSDVFMNGNLDAIQSAVDGNFTHIQTLQNRSTIGGLTCAANQIPKFNGTNWICAVESGANYSAGQGISINNNVISSTVSDTLSGLSCGTSQIARFNGNQWVCANETAYTAGTGIAISGTTISSTQSDTLARLSCTSNQIARFNGNQWICANETAYTAGTGISITGSTISTARMTDSFSVTGGAFQAAFDAVPNNWGRFDSINYGFPKTSAGYYVTSAVHIPTGANINNVHCYFYDNDATYNIASYYLDFRYITLATGGASSIAQASGTATSGQSVSIIDVANTAISPAHTVNNEAYLYYLLVYIQPTTGYTATSSSNIRLYGCKINYTM